MSPTPSQRPYGLWDSPVRVTDVTAGIGLRSPQFDSDGRTLVWLERRGPESVLLCRRRGETAARQLAEGFRVRSKVFYGGGEFAVADSRRNGGRSPASSNARHPSA